MQGLANRIMLLWGFRRALVAILAGAVGVLALPPFGFFAALFVSFTILTWLMDGNAGDEYGGVWGRLRADFATGWLFGLGYFVAGLWWLGNALLVDAEGFAWAIPFAVLGLPAVLAIYYGLATAAAGLLWSEGWGRLAALAAAFGLAEWLRSVLLTGFPWNAIGYGAMPIPVMMQSAHVVGLFGVTLLAVFVFSAPALLGSPGSRRTGIVIACMISLLHIGYGAYRLEVAPDANGDAVAVRLVQPDIDQSKKLDDRERASIFEEHLALSSAPPADGKPEPKIIVWPETSIPFILTQNPDALTRIADVLKPGQILIAGAVRSEDMLPGTPPRYYNSIYVIDDAGQIVAASDKVHLVPFGEYVPFEDVLDDYGIANVSEMPGGYSSGNSRSLLKLPDGMTFYPLICYEIIFPGEMQDAAGTADALLNVTNDAWFGDTPGPYQHFLQARVRAVELGMPLIRAANNGISALVDPYGRVVAGLGSGKRGFIDTSFTRSSEITSDDLIRHYAFWTLLAISITIATLSRVSFVSNKN
jgi:apolipoprotein N-acyltransferase